ncbi:MAG TPA: type II toxin-antitoxin system RelE/ParE family toxin [Chloroflexota bacterium]|nr:type II toxin-antitoxin system RelE/ParE family toxin [Chloroflexota bacterium]
MARVTWTDQALDDLDSICLFIARDAPRYAELFAGRVFRATEWLAQFPQSGRVVPELGRSDIREVVVQNYRVIYRLLPDEVQSLTVHHGARLLRDPERP